MRHRRRRRFGGFLSGSRWPLVLVAAGVLLLAGNASASAAATPTARITNRWRAAGVHPDMQALLDLWEQEGDFDVMIGEPFAGFPGGGLRTAADVAGQLAACQQGLSHACDLVSTAHGRGGALDIWPVGFVPTLSYAEQPLPGMLDKMMAFGRWAQSKGYVWGGTWKDPDYPHVEMKNWPSLPFPPPNY